jgi:glycosyltransferase involved in cell wall biosynthesis
VASLAILTPTYWPEVRRGAERLAHELAAGLDATIVTTHRGAPRRTHEDAVDVVRLPRLPGEGRLTRRMYEDHLTAMPAFEIELRRRPPRAAIALQATAAVASIRAGVPTVFAHMGIPHRQSLVNRRHRLSLVERACREAIAVTALSEAAREAFAVHLGVEATVIPPPVDVERFTPGGKRSERPTVVCAADPAEPRKRVSLLIEAMEHVRAVHPQATLLLDERRATASEGVETVDMRDLPALYRSAWVSALPSWGEAFGLVLAEAMACGTPVVGANREGIPEVLGDDPLVGRLFDGDEPRDIAKALLEAIELARDPATARACRARAERFSAARCTAAYRALLP